jgi:hypothetical protein
MNEQYEKKIEVDGKIYWYDPDRDIYYPRPGPMSTFDKYGWIVISAILLATVLFLEWYQQ